MTFDSALDGLLDLLAVAIVRDLETQNLAAPAAFDNDVALAKGGTDGRRIRKRTRSAPASNCSARRLTQPIT